MRSVIPPLGNSIPRLSRGEILTGKWSGRRYRVDKMLGQGGFGWVYKVDVLPGSHSLAMKLSADLVTITREYTLLQQVNHSLYGKNIVPRVFEMDDVHIRGRLYFYFTMEYVTGKSLYQFILEKHRFGVCEVCDLGIRIAGLLHYLHGLGYIYCDLKPANLLYDAGSNNMRLVDFGGVRDVNAAVTQFTPVYDRGSWGAGPRVATPAYDLFSLCMVLCVLLQGKEPLPVMPPRGKPAALPVTKGIPQPLRKVLLAGLQGEVTSARDFARRLREARRLMAERRAGEKATALVCFIGVAALIFFVLTLRMLIW